MHFELSREQTNKVESLSTSEVKKSPISVSDLEDLCEGNEELEEILTNMLSQCVEYVISVAKFKQIALDSKYNISEALVEIDAVRKTTHDATIDAINVFSRALARNGKDNSWMGEVVGERTRYGRFALTLILNNLTAEAKPKQSLLNSQ